jgi:type I restriction enzyme S subunit
MGVKPGYKQTEVGVIPEEWEVVALGATCSMKSGEGITSANIDQFSQYPCYGGNGLRGFTSRFTHDGSYALIGRQGALCGNVLGIEGKFFASEHAVVVTAHPQIDIRWLTYVLGEMHLNRFSESSAQPGLSVSKVLKLELALPPTKDEQRAIAEALNDVDAMLGALDRLIVKKRDLKLAAMQQLLTGKKRLPGFSGEWEVRLLAEVCWFQEGPGVRNTQFTSSGIKLLNGTNIFRGVLNLDTTSRFISEKEAYGPYAHFMADTGDIVIASSGITIEKFHEKVAFVKDADLPFCMNTSTIRFKPFTSLLPSFFFQFLTTDNFKRMIGGQATGSAQLNFGPSHIAKVILSLPPLPEQEAIAAVLADMDAELAALEQRRNKTRDLKQAMMQELLTGKTHLVSQGGSHA